MIVPDVNILIHAYNADSVRHRASRDWWESTLAAKRPVGLTWPSMLGFMRIMTNRRSMANPFPVDDIVEIIGSWIASPNAELLWPGEKHAEILFRFLRAAGTAGNLTTDAHIAALALEYDAEVATTDRDFGRFAGVKWFTPGDLPGRP